MVTPTVCDNTKYLIVTFRFSDHSCKSRRGRRGYYATIPVTVKLGMFVRKGSRFQSCTPPFKIGATPRAAIPHSLSQTFHPSPADTAATIEAGVSPYTFPEPPSQCEKRKPTRSRNALGSERGSSNLRLAPYVTLLPDPHNETWLAASRTALLITHQKYIGATKANTQATKMKTTQRKKPDKKREEEREKNGSIANEHIHSSRNRNTPLRLLAC